MAAEFWMSSGKVVALLVSFRSGDTYMRKGGTRGWPRRPHHMPARPGLARAVAWCGPLVAHLRAIFWLRGSSDKIGVFRYFPGIFLKVGFLHKNKTPGQFC
jgi:hypothetical protein